MARKPQDSDHGVYRTQLRKVSRLIEAATGQAMAAFAPTPGSSGLDVGCGIGLDAVRLARAVGHGGSVTGLDISQEFIEDARKLAAESDVPAALEFRLGNLTDLPFEAGSFDWVWCKDVLWGHLVDPVTSLAELARVVRPGASVVLVFWSSQVLLPGFPELEARLMEAFVRTTPYTAGIVPERHFMRALGWMRAAGLRDLEVRSFAASVHSPLDDEMQDVVRCTLEMFYGGLERSLSREDWRLVRRLCDPDSDEFLPRSPDYCCLVAYTSFCGKRMPEVAQSSQH